MTGSVFHCYDWAVVVAELMTHNQLVVGSNTTSCFAFPHFLIFTFDTKAGKEIVWLIVITLNSRKWPSI